MALEVNLPALLVGAVVYMVYGGIYYSILLGKKGQDRSGPIKYIVAVIVAFISSFLIGLLVQSTGAAGLAEGAMVGGIIGILISIVYLKNTLFGLISNRMFLIAVGDHLVIFTVLGAIHGSLV
ncbi:DUF1761 domain-containing protein [Rossellomorea sp. AcN35-11]|nr:DUF1761 domain-containing protein [Rossellomorea aquimaris]NMH69244.1 DUF1761 domain-containing protein [Bacillus sp. RO3]WJV29464.1 DUF1761 domain-containing protein [Rossellomorea sp. AcN35-11]